MEIRTVNKSVDEIIQGAIYLGNGASKEAYLKDDTVYKVPRGRYLIERVLDTTQIHYPNKISEVDAFLSKIDYMETKMVWPLGQFAIELLIWEALKELEAEGYDISCFAAIKDYYLDKNGVLVIEQEVAKIDWTVIDEQWDNFNAKIEKLDEALEAKGIVLRDVREGNCGVTKDGRVVLFDFGISKTTSLDNYGSYSDYCDSYDSYDDGGSY